MPILLNPLISCYYYEAFLIPYLVVNVPWAFAMPFSTQPLLNISVFPEIEKRLLCFTA